MRFPARRFWITAALALGSLLTFAPEARADGIDLPVLFVIGAIFLAPLIAFNVLVEGIFLSKGLRIGYERSLAPALWANLASLVSGIPVLILNEWLYGTLLPRDLGPYFRAYPWVAGLATANYFVVTLVVEYAVVLSWCRRKTVAVTAGRVALFVLIANVATYAVLAPLHYYAARPTNDMREFTDDAKWAAQPLTTIYYIDSANGHLCSIASDGSSRKEIVNDDVKDFQFVPGTGMFLYRNGADELCLAGPGAPAKTVCGKTERGFLMGQAAVSPDGKWVAVLRRTDMWSPCKLVFFDIQTGRSIETSVITAKDVHDVGIAWSGSPSVLFLAQGKAVEAIHINPDFTTSVVAAEMTDKDLALVYGRFAPTGWSARFSKDRAAMTEVSSENGGGGGGAHVDVTRNGSRFHLDVNPGLKMIVMGIRGGRDVCILPNGKELLFEDGHGLYIMDMDRRVVGKIADGTRFVIESPRYQRKIEEKEK